MEKEWGNRLNDEGYKNWLKVSLALIQSKEALHDFTQDVIEKIHTEILKRTGSSQCDGTCKTNKGKEPNCVSCTKWVKEIKSYRKEQLNWKNTEPKIWHEVSWEIAKCFMNPQGSKTTAALNTGPKQTDISGILNVLVNCKEFGRSYLKEKKHPEKVREIRNKVMHCPTMTFPEEVMKSYVDSIIALLEDEQCLKNLESCKKTVSMIKLLRDGGFKICPKAEVDCIEGVLRSHELLLESGDVVDHKTRESLDTLSKWIKNNKDLEMKFDLKLNKLNNQLNTRMSSVEFDCGEMKGKIEWLETRMVELEKSRGVVVSQATTSTVGQHDKSLLKNSLQCYAQKKKLGLPKYSHEPPESGKFISTVCIAGKEFRSEEPKSSKKEADQSAAEVALKYFTNEVLDDHKEKALPPDPPSVSEKIPIVPKVQTEKNHSYKNKLQERAQEQKIMLPLYEPKKTETGLFLTEVFFDGAWYSPDILPQGKKIDAEQKAAQFVLAYLERSKEPTAAEKSASPSRPVPECSSSFCNNSTPMAEQTLPRSVGKTCKSILNEHVQKASSKNETPDYNVVECEGKFHCSITVIGKIYESPSPMNSKKEAQESAAMEACSQLNLLEDQAARQSDCPSSPSDIPAASSSPTKDQPNTGTESQSCVELSTASTPEVTDSPDGKKTFQSKLHEYAQSLGPDKRPKYEDIECESGFRIKVTIIGKTYESKISQNSKKRAKEMAAMEAWHDLNPATVSPADSLPSSNAGVTTGEDLPANRSLSDVNKPGVEKSPASVDETSKILAAKSLLSTLNKDDFASLHSSTASSTAAITSTTNDHEIQTHGQEFEPRNSSPETLPPCASDATHDTDRGKPYRSKLNEYVQSVGFDILPEYVDKDGDSGFSCKVIVMNKTYESSSPQKSKKEARENAAKQAYDSLALNRSSCDGVSPVSALTLSGGAGRSEEIDEEDNQNETFTQGEREAIRNEAIVASVPDQEVRIETDIQAAQSSSNYKGTLAEHVKQSKIHPRYVTKSVPRTKDFFSKVFLGKRCFKGERATKKKDAEQNAAKVAFEELKGRNRKSADRNRKSADYCKKTLKEYHESLKVDAKFPKYGAATRSEGGKFSVVVNVVKEWKVSLSESQPKKKDAEEELAKQALTLLEEENKPIQKTVTSGSKSRLNQFCQMQSNVPRLEYNVGGEQASFSGSLCFYTAEEYESLSPQPSEHEATASAAMSACNDLCLI